MGTKPAWEIWAESQLEAETLGERLIAEGWFTVGDLARKNKWTLSKAKHFLRRVRPPLKRQLANDPREYRNSKVRFYKAP